MSKPGLFVGIMSGTSLDGADALVADLSGDRPRVLGFASEPFPADLRAELLALNTSGADEIHRGALAAIKLVDAYARATHTALRSAGHTTNDVTAIGCHGQTVRHRPDLHYTIQLNNPARLAELTGCTVVADFRARDVAAGGQGAPLAPAFHDGVFRSATETRVVANIGGIANLTVLAPGESVTGFDCGPGNCLMDGWIHRHQGKAFDDNGAWAREGRVIDSLLARLMAMPYLSLPAPKSTGRDDFHLAWLDGQLDGGEPPADVQATLLAFTVEAIATHLARHAPSAARLIVCGGGACNQALMAALQARTGIAVESSAEHGVPPGQVEALAFAWFAQCALERRPLRTATITGAAHDAVAGAIYPA